jgi:hypothetical protein
MSQCVVDQGLPGNFSDGHPDIRTFEKGFELCLALFGSLPGLEFPQFFQPAFGNDRNQPLDEKEVAVHLFLRPDRDRFYSLDVVIFVKAIGPRLRPEKLHVRLFQKELPGEEIPIVDAIYDDGCGVIHQSVRAAVTHGGIRLMEMTEDILIAFDAFLQAILVLPVKFGADILPAGGRQDVAVVVDDGGRKGIDFIQPVLQVLEMLHIDQILQFVFHGATPVLQMRCLAGEGKGAILYLNFRRCIVRLVNEGRNSRRRTISAAVPHH